MKIGDRVPDLRGAIGEDAEIHLRELKGQYVVVYFYPKDATPGCTREAQDFRDLRKDFARHKATVLGVSRDSPASHDKFRQKQALDFNLVSDPGEIWCKAFGVIHEKVLYGKRHLGIVRSTFLIGPDGKLKREWRGVKVEGHAAEVLSALREFIP